MSNTLWPHRRLGDVLTQVSRPVAIGPTTQYRTLGMRWYAQGLFAKEIKPGSDMRATKLYRVEQGDLVYNRLFAWKGSFALVDESNHDAFVSAEFPCFRVRKERAYPEYLVYFLSRESVWDEIQRRSTGQTNISRLRLKEPDFLAMEVPLPPVAEQRRIVTRIEQLVAKIEEARGLRASVGQDLYSLVLNAYGKLVEGTARMPMHKVAPLVRRSVQVDPSRSYPELGIRSFGKGTFHKPSLEGILVGSKRLFTIEPGDLLFNNVFAWEGAVAVAKPDDRGRFGSHRFISCVPAPDLATPEFLCFHFLTLEGLDAMGIASPGGAGRNRTLGLHALQGIEVPIPPIDAQKWFTGLLLKAEGLRRLQAQAQAELEALLPSVLDRAFRGEL